jgi:hypothetical protein
LCIAYNLELEIRISYGDWRQLDELNVWTLSITLTGKSKVFMTLHSAFAIEAMERIKDSYCIVNHHIITILKSETAIAVTGESYHVNYIHVTP